MNTPLATVTLPQRLSDKQEWLRRNIPPDVLVTVGDVDKPQIDIDEDEIELAMDNDAETSLSLDETVAQLRREIERAIAEIPELAPADPATIPLDPAAAYPEDWKGWDDFLGKGPPTDADLINWANTQRRLYREGKLSRDKITKLEALPGWTWADQ